jgi:hypothetical protein
VIYPRAIQQLLGSLDAGFLELFSLRGSEGTAIAALMKRYADIRPQLADVALVYLAEGRRRHHLHVGSARFFGLPLGAQASLPHFA